jgi:molybdopterin-containing oxidoreductase family membrane subunit
LWGLWIVSLLLGGVGVYQRLTQGHLPAGYGSYVPWGLWVALYFHGVGIAGGAFVLGAGGFVLDLPGFRSRRVLRTVIVLSIAAILPSFLGVWLDLGHMDRAHSIFLRPALTSMMAFNAWMYNIFMLVAAACFFLSLLRNDRQWLKPLLCLGILFSVLFPSQSGAFFGVVDAKPYWHSPLLPILFLTSAITAGGALLLCVRWLLARDDSENDAAMVRLRRIVLGGLMAYFVLEFAEFSLAVWNPSAHAPAIELVLWGQYWWLFWIIHVALGGVLAFALLVNRRPMAWIGGALLIAVTFVSSRLIVLVPGQLIGELQGLQEAFHHPRLKYMYSATLNEYFVGLFMLAVGMAVFYVGHRINQYLTGAKTEPNEA